MLTIEKAKDQAATLTEYLRTVGKKLKHTHALEAIARINGHKSWNIFESEQKGSDSASLERTSSDLAALFASENVDAVLLDGARYKVVYFNTDVLGAYDEIVAGAHDDYDLRSTCVELERVESGLVYEETFSVEDLSKATYHNGKWTLEDGGIMELFSSATIS